MGFGSVALFFLFWCGWDGCAISVVFTFNCGVIWDLAASQVLPDYLPFVFNPTVLVDFSAVLCLLP